MANAFPGRLIREGEKDKRIVRAIQERLIKVGCGTTDIQKDGTIEKLSVDGDFGPQTTEAVATFQARFDDLQGRRLIVDGEVGANTWGALFGKSSVPTIKKPDSALLAKVIDKARSQIGENGKAAGIKRRRDGKGIFNGPLTRVSSRRCPRWLFMIRSFTAEGYPRFCVKPFPRHSPSRAGVKTSGSSSMSTRGGTRWPTIPMPFSRRRFTGLNVSRPRSRERTGISLNSQ